MKYNLSLAIGSTLLLLLYAGVGASVHLMQAEAIAEGLAPKMGLHQDVLRNHLETILQAHWIRRTIFYCIPWAVLTSVLWARHIAERRGGRKRGQN